MQSANKHQSSTASRAGHTATHRHGMAENRHLVSPFTEKSGVTFRYHHYLVNILGQR